MHNLLRETAATRWGGAPRALPTHIDTDLDTMLGQARRGDARAWAGLYRRSRPAVLRALTPFRLEGDDREDVLQDTFIAAHGALRQLEDHAGFEGWLVTIALNKARNLLARRARRSRLTHLLAAPEPTTGTEAMELEWRCAVVTRFLEQLPAEDTGRTYYLGERTARELGALLGVGKSTITMRLERFRRRHREALAHQLEASGCQWP